MQAYVDRVIEEAQEYKEQKRLSPSTVFIGGGTPSLLSPSLFERLVEGVGESFDLSGVAEFTVEANPGAVDLERLNCYRALGVNRLSFGFQSIHENELKKLGRIHSFADALSSYELAVDCGFDNINVDFMFGIPYQTRESLNKTLMAISMLTPKHISAYGLIIEDGTPFYREKDTLSLPDEDTESFMYFDICDFLCKKGYSHYEISNFAIPGFESRHNLLYWKDKEYVGLGVSAHSYFYKKRYSNSANKQIYMSEPFNIRRESKTLDLGDEMFEYAMMRLRLKEGILLSDYFDRFGVDFLEGKDEYIRKYMDRGFIVLTPERISLTEKGFYISNTILTDLV